MTDVFVRRGDDGGIIAVSLKPTPEIKERLAGDDASLQKFMRELDADGSAALEASDLDVIRVLEDLIELLIGKGVIQFTELPEAAQNKLLKRRNLRQAGGFTLFEEDEGIF